MMALTMKSTNRVNVSKVKELIDQRNKVKQEIETLEKKVEDLNIVIANTCTHPAIVIDSHYSPGGYDDVSSVIITEYCAICDKVLRSYDDPNHVGSHG